MTQPYRIGLLGASRIAPKAIIDPCKESAAAEVTLVAASAQDRADAYAKEHGIKAVASYDDLIARDDVDIIYNGLAPSAHADLSIAALEAGKHVICEKPFCRTLAECDAMLEAAERTGNRLIEAYHYRYHPVIDRMLELKARLEGPLKLDAFFDVTIPKSEAELRWRSDLGGGAMTDLGVYPLHVCRTMAGAPITSITASADWDDGFGNGIEGVDSSLTAALTFDTGTIAKLRCSMVSSSFGANVTLTADNGWARLENFVAPQMGHQISFEIDGEAGRETLTQRPTYSFQLDAILEGLQTGAPTLTEGAETRAQFAALMEIYAKAGRPRV